MKRLSAIVVALLFLSSCTSMKTLVVDVEKPPVVILPPDIKNITIVNNSVIQPENVGHKNQIFGREIPADIAVATDSVDIILMQTLADQFQNSERFNSVFLYEYPTRTDFNYNEEKLLSKEKVAEIAKETNADAILAINKVYFETTSNTIPAYDYDIDSYHTLDLTLNLRMMYYSPQGNAISSPIEIQDSIYWIEAIDKGKVISDPIPSRENAMKAGAELLGKIVDSKMDIEKESVARIYYGDVNEATKLAENNEWNKAKDVWISSFNKESKIKKKARIANNVALSCELTDNIYDAIKWIDIALDLFQKEQETTVDKQYLQTAQLYKQELLQRKNDFRALDLIQ